MVQMIRDTELALGTSIKFPTYSEINNMTAARRSLVATKRIHRGEALQLEMLAAKRPGDGVAPIHLWDLVGKVAQSGYNPDDPIESTFG
jgi:N-acetylneuraminate synthase